MTVFTCASITVSERPGVSVSAPTVTVTEGGSGTYTVKLNLQPTSDVVINVTRSGSADVTASPATLTFTPGNWNTAQTVRVAAAEDADAANEPPPRTTRPPSPTRWWPPRAPTSTTP